MNRASFYITGGTVPDTATCYVERAADTELLQGILDGAYVYVLDSRQMGKSSLCIRTLRRLNELDVRTAFVDLTKFGVRNITVDQWFIAMLREVGRGLNLSAKLMDYWRANTELAPVQRFFGALQDAALAEIPGRIAIIIDEIDVTRSLPFDTDEFFAGIRQCYIGRATDPNLSRLTFSLIGTATPTELIKDTRVSPFNVGQRVELQDFSYDEALVLAEYLPGDSKSVLRRILHWTGGHPYLTQRLCQQISQKGSTDVDEACTSLFLDRRAKESDDNLAFVRNRLLKNELDLGALLELYRKVRGNRDVRDDETNPLCAVLKMSGITRAQAGKLKIRNRIYGQVFDLAWVQEQMPDAESRRQRAAYRMGVLRATGIAAAAIIVVGGLAVYGFSQARIARTALASAKRLTESLKKTEKDLRASLTRTNEALGDSKRAQQNAKDAADQSDVQKNLAKLAAARANAEAANARIANETTNSTLSRALVATGMQRLDSGDAAGAIEPLLSALKLDQKDPHRAAMHRLRLSYALRKALNLRQVWSGRAKMIDAEFLPDGVTVVTANADGNVRLWNASTGLPASPVMFHAGLSCFALSKDGRHAVTGALTGGVKWWDLRTGNLLSSMANHVAVRKIALSDDNTRVAVATAPEYFSKSDEFVFLYNIRSGRKTDTPFRAKLANISGLVFSPSGRRLVVMGMGYSAATCDIGDGKGTGSISTCYGGRQCEFVRNGKAILINGVGAGNTNGVIQLCTDTGKTLSKYKTATIQDGQGVAFRQSADGESILAAMDSGTLQMFDLRTAKPKGTAIRSNVRLTDCDLSPNGQLVAAAAQDGTVRTWDLSSGEQVGPHLWHGASVSTVHFDRTGTRLLTCSDDGTARLWDVDTSGLKEEAIGTDRMAGNPIFVWNARGTCIVSGRNATYRWDTGSGQRAFPRGYRFIRSSACSTESRRIILAKDRAFRVYDFDRDEFITPPLKAATDIVGLSPDGRYAFAGMSPSHLRFYDLDHRARIAYEVKTGYDLLLETHFESLFDDRNRIVGVGISSTANRFYTNGKAGELDLWELNSGRHVASVGMGKRLWELKWNGNGSMLAANIRNKGQNSLIVVRSSDGGILKTGLPFAQYPWAAYFNAEGTRLLDPDKGAIWDTASWKPVATYPHKATVTSIEATVDPAGKLAYLPQVPGLFDMKTGKSVPIPDIPEYPRSTSFSSKSRFLAISTSTSVYIIDLLHKDRAALRIPTGSMSRVGFVPANDLMFTITAARIRLWDPESGEEVVPGMLCHGSTEAEFSPTGDACVCVVGGQVVVRSFAPDRRPLDILNRYARAIEQASVQKIDAKTWQVVCKLFANSRGGLAEPSTYAPNASASETYSIDDAVRDLGFRLGDAKGLLIAAQASARSEQWEAANQSIEEAVRQGASGIGIQFLRGGIAIREKRFTDAVAAFMAAWDNFERSSEPRESKDLDGPRITGALAQALIGAGQYSEVGAALEKSIPNEPVPTTLARKTYSMLALAARGDILMAKEQFRELMTRNRKGDFRDQCDYIAPELVTTGVALNLVQELPVRYLAKPDDANDIDLATAMLEFTRTGQFEAASRLRASLAAFPPTPQFLLADALIAHHAGVTSYRDKLRACIQGCQAIAKRNNCEDIDAALVVCQANIFEREARQRLDSLTPR